VSPEVGDPLIPFGYLLTQFLNLTLLTFDSALLFFPAWRLRVRMPTGRDLLACAPSGSRIHPPYVKRFRGICPERSARKPVRMRNDGGVNSYKSIHRRAARSPTLFPRVARRSRFPAAALALAPAWQTHLGGKLCSLIRRDRAPRARPGGSRAMPTAAVLTLTLARRAHTSRWCACFEPCPPALLMLS
jgi:hypothetical protein